MDAGRSAAATAGSQGVSRAQTTVGVSRAGTAAEVAGASGAQPTADKQDASVPVDAASSASGSSGAVAGNTRSAAGSGSAGMAAAPDDAAITQARDIHCVHWADTRDNFVNGLLQLSGLDSSQDNHEAVKSKTSQVAAEFRDKLGANTLRIPINEPTVAGAWWDSYKGVIDAVTGMHMNVIVAYWAHANGRPDDENKFMVMWEKVVAAYADNNRVFFDIHNEPQGYRSSWNDVAARWLDKFPALPRARVLVAGTGADDNVVPVGKDSRFDGCVLQLHYYAFWHKDWTTQQQWTDQLEQSLGSYASRTIIGEWGAAMSTGLDYNRMDPDGNNEISYITATASYLRTNNMGSCYWPGLRDQDTYALMKRDANASPITLSVVNDSGRDQLLAAWNLP